MPAWVLSIAALIATCVVTQPASGQGSEELQGRVEALTEQVRLRYGAYLPAYEPRLEVIRTVLSRWNKTVPGAGEATPTNRARLDAWLDAALRAVMPGGSGDLPPAPRFQRPRQRPIVGTAPEVPLVEPTPKPAASVLRRTRSSQLTARPAATARPATEPSPAARRPDRPRQASPQGRTTQSNSPFLGPRLTHRGRDARAMPLPTPAERPPRVEARAPRTAAADLVAIEPRDPFADDPGASPNPLRARPRRVARRPVVRNGAASVVDLSKLTAEIRGYNAAMRELQGEVMRLGRSDLRGLSASADELDRLEEKRRFLDLYRRGLSKASRDSLPDSPSAELIRELVRRRTLDLIRQTPPERRAERRALQRLNDRLAQQGRTAANF